MIYFVCLNTLNRQFFSIRSLFGEFCSKLDVKRLHNMATGGPLLRPRPSAELDYFDIDDIIATQGRMPVKLEVQIFNLGFLDPSSEGNDLQSGGKLEWPFWLAKELCNRRRKTISVEIPKAYKDGYREIFKADASVVDLHRLGPYFYEYGTKLLHFDFEENSQIALSLQEVLQYLSLSSF